MPRRWAVRQFLVIALTLPAVASASTEFAHRPATAASGASPAVAAARPNIVLFNLDDLRDALPGNVDPLQFMPQVQQWMSTGTRFTKSFVVEPSCCPSRAAMMTGRFPHNNGVRLQSQGPIFDSAYSMACYLRGAGYSTYLSGKFLTTWPRTQTPPCFQHSTVVWGGYHNIGMRVDGVWGIAQGYATTFLGVRAREYVNQALGIGAPFLLYVAPTAPHWAEITNPDGTTSRLAVPEAQYAHAPVGTCSGPGEPDRSDKPAYVRNMNHTQAQAQAMCASQLRAIMSVDDQFGATMQMLLNRGVLANTLVMFTSDNGYMWGEHGRTEKFVPYEPSLRVPLLVRWPGQIGAGVNGTRLVSNLDLLPTMLQAAQVTLPANAPRLDGESLLAPSGRSTIFGEYWRDSSNGFVNTWRAVRTGTVKYVHTYNDSGGVIFREYYNLNADPQENTNLLADGNPGNDPPPSQVSALTASLNALAGCAGAGCVR